MNGITFIILLLVMFAFSVFLLTLDAIERSKELDAKLRLKEEAFRECEKETDNWNACFKAYFNDFKG